MTILPLYTALLAGCRGSGLLGTWPEACEAGVEAYHQQRLRGAASGIWSE